MTKSLSQYFCYIYIFLWIVYYLQDILMLKGIISQIILGIVILVSIFAFFYVNFCYRIGPFLKWLNLILAVVSIYGFVLFFSGLALYPDEINMMTNLQFGYLQRIYCSVLPIYAFYLFALKGYLLEENLIHIFLFILVATVLLFYQSYFRRSEMMEREEITNNIGYRFVPLIPMLTLVRIKDTLKYIFLIVIVMFIVMSLKRGAILTGTLALLLFIKHHLKAKSTKQVAYMILLTTVAFCTIYLFVMNFYETSDYFKIRFNNTLEGNSSGRDYMYLTYFDFFIHHTSAFEFFFGSGANATYIKLGQYAHNDWLEFAIDLGVFGVVLYAFYWVNFIHEWMSFRTEKGNRCKQVLGDLIVLYFIKSLFSMSFDGMFITATLCIGYCLAQKQRSDLLSVHEH